MQETPAQDAGLSFRPGPADNRSMRKLLEIASLIWMVVGLGLVTAVSVTAIRSKELPHVWGSCDMKGADKGGPPFQVRPLPREQWIRRPSEVFVVERVVPQVLAGLEPSRPSGSAQKGPSPR